MIKNEPSGRGMEKYLGILANLDISYFELDLKGNFTFVSDITCRHLGYSRKELLGMNFRTYSKTDNAEKIKQVYREIYRTGEPKTTINLEIVNKDGHLLTAQLSMSLMRDASGQPTGFRGVAIDITQKIREEQIFLETEKKYRSILEIMEEGYVELDLKGNFIFVSDAVCRHTGYSRQEMIGINYRNIYQPDVAQRLRTVFTRVYKTGKPEFLIDFEFICKDGSRMTLETSVALLRDVSGAPVGYSSLARNVTERRKTGDALRDSEEKYRNVLENMAEGLFETDLRGNYTFLNKAACRMVGYTRDEMIGKNYRMLHTQDTVRYLTEAYSRMYERHKVESLLDYEAVRKDGAIRVHQANASIIRDKTGEIVGFRALVRDITENKRAEEALRQSEERYRTILETMEEAYAEYDLKGNIVFVNDAACRLLGYDRNELIGMNYRKYHTPEVARFIRDVFSRMYQTGEPQFLLDYEAIRKDGSLRICEMNAVMLRETSGRKKGFSILVRDVTQRKQSEEEKARIEQQLLQAQKMESVGRLAGGVAHDFNNMITVILGYAEMIRLRLPADNSLLKDLREIEKAATRSRDITRQLLAFSRKAIIVPKNIHLNHLIVDIQKTILRLLGEDIDLKFYPEEGLWTIKVDPSQVEHVLINLAVNARDAMANGGKLTIETRNVSLGENYCRTHPGFLPGDYIMLGVSDEGVGMDKETLGRIFDPFFTTKETGKGTGLGLSMVYGIVKQNDGFINVYSEPGKGTTFSIYIPRSRDESTEKKKEEEEAQAQNVTGTILLVEDDEMVRTLTTEMLESLGFKTFSASSPQEALCFFRESGTKIDLMITDVVMPGMSGKVLAEKVMALRPQMKVLFMSGYTTNVIAHRGILDEGVNFIQKPFSMGDLARKVSGVLNG